MLIMTSINSLVDQMNTLIYIREYGENKQNRGREDGCKKDDLISARVSPPEGWLANYY